VTPDDLSELLRSALERAGEAEADAYGSFARRGFARFSVGNLGQHMHLEEPLAVVRVARGKRVAEVSADLDPESLVEALHTAGRIAEQLPEDETFPGFAGKDEPEPVATNRYAEATAQATAESRVELLAPVFERIAQAGLLATGALDTTTRVEAVATTRGLVRSHRSTLATFKVWALESAGAKGASGHGMCADVDVDRLDLARETEVAVADALRSKNPGSLPAGSYDTVLGPLAFAELIEWLSMIGLGARELEQGLSPLSDRMGERITNDAFTVEEDPTSDLALAAPFDREGVARRHQVLIGDGIARGVVHDRTTAHRAGVHSTGNAASPDSYSAGGPTPSALVVKGGTAASVEELVSGVARGLYVRRLHYVNGMLEPRRAVMTGLTRDGTFLVENGKVTGAVESMRFTDSLLEALERSDGFTTERVVVPNWWSAGGSVATPGVRVRGLKFSSGSRET
jgi:predicted Zn-dependent protease